MNFLGAILIVFLAVAAFAYEDNSYMRIEAQLIRLENPQGLTATGSPCGGQVAPRQCNTIVAAEIDINGNGISSASDPYSTRNQSPYKVISTSHDDNDPHIDKVIAKDVCGKSVEKALVRVRVYENGISRERRINDFVCEAALHRQYVHSVWSGVQLCEPEFQTQKMRLYFRYRVTRLDEQGCHEEQHQ